MIYVAAMLFGVLMVIKAVKSWIEMGSRDADRVINKYPLGDIKATLKAKPDKPCNNLTEWGYHIHNLRNGKI